jgi:serine/threonine protein kinase
MNTRSLKKFIASDYKMIRSIGEGAFSDPYLATTKTGDKVVVKSFDRKNKSLEKIGIFPAEYIFMRNLSYHDNIAKILTIFHDDHKYYIIMDYYPGGDLFDYTEENMDELCHRDRRDVALNFARQILDALEYCHKKNIIHRDIKPENILLSKDKKKVYLTDFGLAALQKPDQKLTAYVGSSFYLAPELILKKNTTDVKQICGLSVSHFTFF